jgi:hypothetical protein
MRDLGNGMIALALLQIALASLLVVIASGPEKNRAETIVVTVVIGVLASTFLGLGILARRRHAWVNYVVATLAVLVLGVNIINLGRTEGETARPGAGTGTCFGLVIAAALLYYSVTNLQWLSRAKVEELRDSAGGKFPRSW